MSGDTCENKAQSQKLGTSGQRNKEFHKQCVRIFMKGLNHIKNR